MPHNTRKLLLDLTISCEEVLGFIHGKDFESFQKNRLLQLALEREFQIIGEAFVRLEKIDQETLGLKIPEYRKIIGFRNVIVHGYEIVDDAALWDFANNLVPDLLEKVRSY